MKPAVNAVGPILGLMVLVALGCALLDIPVGNAIHFLFIAPLGLVILGALAAVRRWHFIPWLPWFGLAWATTGFAMNSLPIMNAGFFVFVILTVWHEHQRERPARSASAASAS